MRQNRDSSATKEPPKALLSIMCFPIYHILQLLNCNYSCNSQYIHNCFTFSFKNVLVALITICWLLSFIQIITLFFKIVWGTLQYIPCTWVDGTLYFKPLLSFLFMKMCFYDVSCSTYVISFTTSQTPTKSFKTMKVHSQKGKMKNDKVVANNPV